MLAAGLALLCCLPQQPQPGFSVTNGTDRRRTETVRVSVPFANGARPAGLDRLAVWPEDDPDGRRVDPVVPLLHWRDGSVAVAQVHAVVTVAPHSVQRFRVAAAGGGPFTPGPAAFPELPGPLETVVEDPWGRPWRAELTHDRTLVHTRRLRIDRLTGVHRAEHAPEQAFLAVRADLVRFAGERRAELTLVLDNAPADPDRVLGPVRFRRFTLVTADDRLRFLPRFAEENALSPPLPAGDGGFRQDLLGPSDDLYLGDGTAKAWRFDLFLDGEDVGEDGRRAARAAADEPLRPIPGLTWVRHTGAFGVHGGPAPRMVAAGDASDRLLTRWRRTARFGPFGGWGDPEDAAAQGTPRNGPSLLHNAVRWNRPDLLHVAEGMVLQHTLRPTPGRVPARPEDTAPFRQGLGPRAIVRPHGFTALDYEHFSVVLLYDWFWLTGDPLARDELRRMGRGLRPLLEGVPFFTCRGEGWCLQGGAMIARATGDEGLARWLAARFRDDVFPVLGPPGATWVLRQPPHPDAFGLDGGDFDAPWQMAALIHGLHALTGTAGPGGGERALLRATIERTARAMAGPGWATGVGPKYLVSALDPGRYRLPVGHGPLAGTAWMETGAFVLASETTHDPNLRQLLRRRGETILEPWLQEHRDPETLARVAASPWWQLALDRGWGTR